MSSTTRLGGTNGSSSQDSHEDATDQKITTIQHQLHQQQQPTPPQLAHQQNQNQHLQPTLNLQQTKDPYHPENHDPSTATTGSSAASRNSVESRYNTGCMGLSQLGRIVHEHYSNVHFERSEEQLYREQFILGKIKFSRWLLVPSAFMYQAVCGTLYSWSVFNNLIDNELYGNDQGPSTVHNAAITFYIALGCLGISSSITGPWLERHGPKKAGLAGAILFFLGNMITAVGIHFKFISLVYIGYGIFGGLGLGIAYISPVSALQKFFPDRRGFAAGVAVSGFGAGSIAMAKIPDPLSSAVGLPLTFVILGSCYFVTMVIAAFVFRVPPPGYIVNGMDVYAVSVANTTMTVTDNTSSTVNADGSNIRNSLHQQDLSGHSRTDSKNHHSHHHHQNPMMMTSSTLHLSPMLQDDQLSAISPRSDTTMLPPTPVFESAAEAMKAQQQQQEHNHHHHHHQGHSVHDILPPPVRPSYDPSTTITLMASLTSREYRLMYLMLLGNIMAGVVIISRMANMATDIFGLSKDNASTIVSINGGFNLVGRIVFASLSDRIGRKNSYMIMLGSQVIILAVLPTIMEKKCNWAFLLTIWILTACYGGGFGCIPAFLTDLFGPANIGGLHGIILTAWSISSVGAGLIFTAVYNYLLDHGYTIHDPEIYTMNLHWILPCVCLAFIFTLFIRTGVHDRLLPRIAGEWFHIRCFGRILRVGTFGFRWMTRLQEQVEWTSYTDKRQEADSAVAEEAAAAAALARASGRSGQSSFQGSTAGGQKSTSTIRTTTMGGRRGSGIVNSTVVDSAAAAAAQAQSTSEDEKEQSVIRLNFPPSVAIRMEGEQQQQHQNQH